MPLSFWIILLIGSLAVLVKSADIFTTYSEKFGLALGIPKFIIGVLIVGVGTSLPELVTSLIAATGGNTEIVAANVLGSNIFNYLVIIGLTAIVVRRLEVERDLIDLDLPLLAGFGGLLFLSVMDGNFTRYEGLVAMAAFAAYVHYSLSARDRVKVGDRVDKRQMAKYLFFVLASGFFIYFGAQYTVESAVKISQILGIGTGLIAITAIAAGTSFPELAVSITAARRKKFELSFGNIIGSNIFNGSLIMGVSALVSNLKVAPSTLEIGLPFFAVTTVLAVISGISRKIHLWEGLVYLAIYAVFIFKLIDFAL